MLRPSSTFAIHNIAISLASLTLLVLSITLLALESRVQDAFPNGKLQYPGSSMAEFLFVPLNPPNIDTGPSVVKFAVGACSMITALLSLSWPLLHWCRACGRANIVHIRMAGSAACVASVTNTAAGIGFIAYLFITEAGVELPQYFSDWNKASFTQEFYVCTAIPSIFPSSEDTIYGFPACEKAQAGRYLTLVICCISALLAGLSIIRAHLDGVFATFVTVRRPPRRPQEPPRHQEMSITPPHAVRLQPPSHWASRSRTDLHGYFARA